MQARNARNAPYLCVGFEEIDQPPNPAAAALLRSRSVSEVREEAMGVHCLTQNFER